MNNITTAAPLCKQEGDPDRNEDVLIAPAPGPENLVDEVVEEDHGGRDCLRLSEYDARPMWGLVEAPAATIDALIHELREDGVAALPTPGCQRRLAAISFDQTLDVIARLNDLRARYPKITDNLILRIGERVQQ